jgi:hypothetical protein
LIGGRILDASFVASFTRGDIAAAAWLDVALELPLALYLPSLALVEVRAVRPAAGPQVAELLGHPSVLLGELDADTTQAVARLLSDPKIGRGRASGATGSAGR